MAEPEKYKTKTGETKWKFRVYLGVDPKTGKQKYTNRQGFNTKKEANLVLKRIESQVVNETYFNQKPTKKYTFKELYEEWLENEYKHTVRESTLLVTTRLFKQRILPKIGDYKLEKIEDKDIQKLANEWSQHESASKWINNIKRVFNYGNKMGYTKNKPVEYITIKKPKHKPKAKTFYETDELKLFMEELDTFNSLQAQVFLRLLFFTGIRRGEGLALEWQYVDFDNSTIRIEASTTRVYDPDIQKTHLTVGAPKNEASRRTISVDEKTLDYLYELYQKRINHRVFNSENGGLLSDGKPRKWLQTVAKRAGLEPIKVHGTRHTHASLLFESGATPKDVQKRLGHSKIGTTLDIYTHVTNKSTQNLGERFANHINF